MFKIRHPIPGEPPGALRLRQEIPETASVITLIDYDQTHLDKKWLISEPSELLAHFDSKRVTWINIDGLGDVEILRMLGERFNLHPLALEDVLDTGQRPKVEQYGDYLFIVAQMLYLDQEEACVREQVSMFLGKTFLITLQEEAEFDVFRTGACPHPGRRRADAQITPRLSGLCATRFDHRSLLSGPGIGREKDRSH